MSAPLKHESASLCFLSILINTHISTDIFMFLVILSYTKNLSFVNKYGLRLLRRRTSRNDGMMHCLRVRAQILLRLGGSE